MKTIPDNSIDSIVTDPPYGLGFMGKEWDTFDKSQFGNIPDECSDENVYNKKGFNTLPRYKTDGLYQFAYDWAAECLRVLKPGGHLLSFAGSRTYHKICMGIEDAGFEIRDQIMWVYGQGFPKSLNISKALDKVGIENELHHLGTSLKPAHEPIVLARKPLSEKSIAENVLKHGTGGINIDGSRIGTDDIKTNGWGDKGFVAGENYEGGIHQGRFPANIIFDEEAGKLLDEQSGNKTGARGLVKGTEPSHTKKNKIYGDYSMVEGKYAKPKDDLGGASRFFYCPKASKKDKNIDDTTNNHPTVKPTDLMRYLINLVTPKGGTTLDPFMGSGSTGKAAVRCGVNFIGIEKEEEYMKIAKARIEHEKNKPRQQELF